MWVCFLLLAGLVQHSHGVGPCTGDVYEIESTVSTHSCLDSMVSGTTYPDDHFENITANAMYICPVSNKRIMVSNGVPDHGFTLNATGDDAHVVCETNWWVEVPLYPELSGKKTEPSPDYIVGMSATGIPFFGNGIRGDSMVYTDYIHHGITFDGSFHYLALGTVTNSSESLLGYALDGFEIYGTLDDDSGLDECNGRTVDGVYRYHARQPAQVDYASGYCNVNGEDINYNFIVGCYKGSVGSTNVTNYLFETLPDDCGLVEQYSNNPEILGFTLNTTVITPSPTISWENDTDLGGQIIGPARISDDGVNVGLIVGSAVVSAGIIAGFMYYYGFYLASTRAFTYIKV